MSEFYDERDFEHAGYKFRRATAHDSDMGRPWERHDGHIDVYEMEGRRSYWQGGVPKKAGEVVLYQGRDVVWGYNVVDALAKAKAEGWGLSGRERGHLRERLGREPTSKEVRAEAVRRDAERMQDWLNDQWSWVTLRVQLLDADGDPVATEYCGGYESDDPDMPEHAAELANMILADLGAGEGKPRRLLVDGQPLVTPMQVRADHVTEGSTVLFDNREWVVTKSYCVVGSAFTSLAMTSGTTKARIVLPSNEHLNVLEAKA